MELFEWETFTGSGFVGESRGFSLLQLLETNKMTKLYLERRLSGRMSNSI